MRRLLLALILWGYAGCPDVMRERAERPREPPTPPSCRS